MFLQLFNILPLNSLKIPRDQYMILIGLIFSVIGSSLAIWENLTMKQGWGPPAQHEIKKQQNLVITGPFAFTRNPIYIGLLLYFLGFEVALGSYLAILVIPFAYLLYRAILIEEKLLMKHFGKKFRAYTTRVPRFL